MINLDRILKSRDIIFPTKVCLVKAMVFPVVMYGCNIWTIKKAEHWRIDVFELWCWRRLLRVPWTSRRSNQSILKEIGPNSSLEGLIFKLKVQCFGQLMWRADSFEKTLVLGKIEGRRRRGQQRMSWLDGITDSMDMRRPGVLWSMGSQKSWTRLSDWTELNWLLTFLVLSSSGYRPYHHTMYLFYASYSLPGIFSLDWKSLHTWILFVVLKQYFFLSFINFFPFFMLSCLLLQSPNGVIFIMLSLNIHFLWTSKKRYQIISYGFVVKIFLYQRRCFSPLDYICICALMFNYALNMKILASLSNGRKIAHPVLRESLTVGKKNVL